MITNLDSPHKEEKLPCCQTVIPPPEGALFELQPRCVQNGHSHGRVAQSPSAAKYTEASPQKQFQSSKCIQHGAISQFKNGTPNKV